jgi:hypothetical protein
VDVGSSAITNSSLPSLSIRTVQIIPFNNIFQSDLKFWFLSLRSVLEFQAMPHLFHSLRLSTVDWGVISTYVCPASCRFDCFAEEFVFIQPSV